MEFLESSLFKGTNVQKSDYFYLNKKRRFWNQKQSFDKNSSKLRIHLK